MFEPSIVTFMPIVSMSMSITLILTPSTPLTVTIEGSNINYEEIIKKIENSGAVVHSVDEVAVGSKLIENIRRET